MIILTLAPSCGCTGKMGGGPITFSSIFLIREPRNCLSRGTNQGLVFRLQKCKDYGMIAPFYADGLIYLSLNRP